MNLISAINDNIPTTLEELEEERVKLIERLAEVYAEIARYSFIQAVVRVTSHYEKENKDA